MTTETTPLGDEHGKKRRWRWTRRALFGSGIALALAGTGAFFGHAQSRHHGWGHHGAGAMDAESATEWAQLMTRQALRRVDATPDQEARIQAIIGGALKDLLPLRDEGRLARKESLQLIGAASIDRNAIERLRAGQIAVHEQASKRVMQAVLEIADVLKPEQREQLTKMIAERRWGRHG